jgi:hypothetical protein
MKIKIVVSLSIFSLLFASAWLLQVQLQNHRKSDVTNMESHNNMNVVPMNNEYTPMNTNFNSELSNVQRKLFEPFKPREYVRIIDS